MTKNDQTKEIMALIRSELDKGFEKPLWREFTSDNKVISTGDIKAIQEMTIKILQELNSKYLFEPATIVCNVTNYTPEDAAKGIVNVTITLPSHLEEIMLENLGPTHEN
jgi:hypothetical protein